jgi:CBS domain-containing protein
VKEYADFLSGQSPYDALDADDLQRLVRHVDIEFVAAGTTIVQENSEPLSHLCVVRTGLVEVVDRGTVVDQLGQGDSFGHISVLSGLSPALSVRAVEDTLLYILPDPRTVLSHPEHLRFSHYGSLVGRPKMTKAGTLHAGTGPVSRFGRPIIWCESGTSLQETARRITEAGTSCALINTEGGVAILTDSDFRKSAGNGSYAAAAPAAAFARHPVLEIAEDAPVATAFLRMLEHGVHHLVLTSRSGRPTGVVRVVDLTSAETRDPLLIREAIRDATNLDQLRKASRMLRPTAVELADSGLSATQIAPLLAAVTEAVLRRLVELNGTLAASTSAASLLVLGSLARNETLPLSDVDTGLVWEQPIGGFSVAASMRGNAERLIEEMESCGLARCPDGANASNPLFARSVSGWTAAARGWMSDDANSGALLLTSMVADSRPVTNVALGRRVLDILSTTARSKPFLDQMMRFTLAIRPPTGFVRDFVVEHSGEHKGQLNLKKGGLRPLANLGRWVAIVTGEPRGSTPERVSRGADVGLFTVDEAETLKGAHAEIFGLLMEQEIEAIRSGTRLNHHVDPKSLDSLTRRHLRESFRAISSVQSTLQGEWVSRLRTFAAGHQPARIPGSPGGRKPTPAPTPRL